MELRALVPTATSLPIPTSLDALRRIIPPRSVVHVGAGNGFSAARLWGGAAVEHLWLIDANPDERDQLSAATSEVGGWDAACVLLADQDREDGVYYVTSNPSANGRVSAEDLRAIWPNLRSIRTHRTPERRLDGILDARNASALPAPNWIYVDCFPAIPILKGAGRYLEDVDVVWARVVLDERLSPPDGSSLRELVALLSPKGFRQIEVTEGLHPAIGEVLFVRDWRLRFQAQIQELETQIVQRSRLYDDQAKIAADRQTQIDTLAQERDTQAKLVAELTEQASQLDQARDAQAQLAAERQTQIEMLAQERDVQAKLVAELTEQASQLGQARDAQAQLAVERQTQIEMLAHERDTQAKLLAELTEHASQLGQARDAQAQLAAERQTQLEALAQERDTQAKLAGELAQQASQLAQARDAQVQLAAEQAAKAAELAQARDVQAKLAAERQAQIEKLGRERDAQAQLAAERHTQIEMLAQERDVQAELMAEQAAKAAELAQRRDAQATLAAEGQTQIDKLAQERDDLAKRVTEHAEKASQLAQACDAQVKLAIERQAQLEQALQAKAGQEQIASERFTKIQQLQQEAETANRSIEDLREDLRQARQTANLATKLHVLREADLEDLQSRYREATDVQERQHQLMLQLEGKLRIAAQYFRQLQSGTVPPVALAAVASPPAKPIRRRAASRKKSDAMGPE